jgi:hypothetical protein
MPALYCKTFRDDIEFASQNDPSAGWLFFPKSDFQARFAGDGAVISARGARSAFNARIRLMTGSI